MSGLRKGLAVGAAIVLTGCSAEVKGSNSGHSIFGEEYAGPQNFVVTEIDQGLTPSQDIIHLAGCLPLKDALNGNRIGVETLGTGYQDNSGKSWLTGQTDVYFNKRFMPLSDKITASTYTKPKVVTAASSVEPVVGFKGYRIICGTVLKAADVTIQTPGGQSAELQVGAVVNTIDVDTLGRLSVLATPNQ